MARGKAGRSRSVVGPAVRSTARLAEDELRSAMSLRKRGQQDLPADVPEARGSLPTAPPAVAHLDRPAPARLALTAGWNLAESLGLPVIAYLIGERLGGQGAGMAAAAGIMWLTAIVRKVATGNIPGLLLISGLVLTLQAV